MSDPEPIRSTEEIDDVFARSRVTPVFIFKHSLTCPISAMAYREFQDFIGSGAASPPECRLVEVQRARDVSTAIAERTGVRHESPQALLVHGGEVIWHASHGAITQSSLRRAADSSPS